MRVILEGAVGGWVTWKQERLVEDDGFLVGSLQCQ